MKATNALMISAIILAVAISGCIGGVNMNGKSSIELDSVKITWLGHASFRITDGTSTLYIDPYVLDDGAPDADFILITHSHFDHCSEENVKKLQGNATRIIAPLDCVTKFTGKTNSVKAGESFSYAEEGVRITAMHAYNANKFRSPDNPFHPKGFGVGFVIEIGGKRIYHAGDTDVIDEMNVLNGTIDLALLPAGGTYTMTMAEAAEAAAIIRPKFVVPMHYNSDKYGVTGLEKDIAPLAKGIAGKGIVLRVLEPVV